MHRQAESRGGVARRTEIKRAHRRRKPMSSSKGTEMHSTMKARSCALYVGPEPFTGRDIDQVDDQERFRDGIGFAIRLSVPFWILVAALWLVFPRIQAAAGIP